MANKTLVVLAILALFGLVFSADCAREAYAKSCSSCSFDANGKMDASCSAGYKASGTACYSTSYPIMSAKYAEGKCAEVEACASELSSCSSQYASGNDKTDCAEGSVSVCYSAADSCMRQAAVKCGEVENPCQTPALILLGVVGAALFVSRI